MPENETLLTRIRGLTKLLPYWLRRPDWHLLGVLGRMDTPRGEDTLREIFAVGAAVTILGNLVEVGETIPEEEFTRQAPKLYIQMNRQLQPDWTGDDLEEWVKRIQPSFREAIKRGWIIRVGGNVGLSERAAVRFALCRRLEELTGEGSIFNFQSKD